MSIAHFACALASVQRIDVDLNSTTEGDEWSTSLL